MQLELGKPATGFGYLARSQSLFVEIPAGADSGFSYGVQMTVDSSTECITPTGQSEIRFVWQHEYKDQVGRLPIWYVKESLGGQRSRLEMRLADEAGESVFALAELAEALQRGEATPLNLRRLNQLGEMLFALAHTMGKHQLTLGLIDPGNVFFIPEKEETAALPIRSLLLADLFLVPRRDDAPSWIVNRKHYNFIWQPEYEAPEGDGTLERRKYLNRQSSKGTFDPHGDTRCIARMFAWVLTGKAFSEIPLHSALSAPVWDEFRRLLNDRQGTAESIVTGIQAPGSELSVHLTPSPPDSQIFGARGVPWLGLLSAIAILLCMVAGYIKWLGNGNSGEIPIGSPYFNCPDCPLSSRLHSHFLEQQVPLIADFQKAYRYEEDSDIWEMGTPSAISPLLLSLDILSAQSANLRSQLDVIEASFELADGESNFDCIGNELRRLQVAFRNHVIVVDQASNKMGAMQGMKVLVREMKELGQRLDSIMLHKEINIPCDTQILNSLKSNPELEQELAELFPPAARLGSEEVARMFVITIRSIGPE